MGTDVISENSTLTFQIERISNRERVLDYMVFRNFSPSLEKYLIQNPQLTEQKAVEILTRTYDDQGQFLRRSDSSSPQQGELVQFAAVAQDESSREVYRETNGVVGVVDVFQKSTNALELKNLRVHESARRKGIAKALVEKVQEYAIQAVDRATVFLNYDPENIGAMHLYASRGFRNDTNEEFQMIWSPLQDERCL